MTTNDAPRPLEQLLALGTYQGMSDKEIEKIMIQREVEASRKARRRGDAVNARLSQRIQNEEDRELVFNYMKMLTNKLAETREKARAIYHEEAENYRRSLNG